MALVRYVTEMGIGIDVHGGDYTKAAKRAVSDAIRHSSLNFFHALNKSPDDMRITVNIGVAEPNKQRFCVIKTNKTQLDKNQEIASLTYNSNFLQIKMILIV